MRAVVTLFVGFALGLAAFALVPSGHAAAPAKAPLFINMTTGDSWRGWMGLHFAHSTLKMGHPVTVFLNLDAVKLAAKTGEQEKRPSMQRVPREIVADFVRDGGTVLMCPPCMAEFGLKPDDLVDGVKMGRPGLTQDFIFAEGARTLTW